MTTTPTDATADATAGATTGTTTLPGPTPTGATGGQGTAPDTSTGSHRSPRSARRTRAAQVPWTTVVAAVVAGMILLAAVAPSLLATHDPFAIDLAAPLQPPSWEHWLGTDQSGRDLYSRIVHGTAPSLLIGFGAAALGVGLALALGVSAALGGRWADAVIGRGIEVLFAFPTLLLAMVFITVYGPSVPTLILAVGLGTAPGYARMVRGQVLAVRHSGYVQAAHAMGHSRARVLRQHILPNAVRPLVAVLTLGIGQSIVWASGLAFLGFGVAPPSPEWGALLEAGRPYITEAWWLEIMPGVAVLATALTATVLGKQIESSLEGSPR